MLARYGRKWVAVGETKMRGTLHSCWVNRASLGMRRKLLGAESPSEKGRVAEIHSRDGTQSKRKAPQFEKHDEGSGPA